MARPKTEVFRWASLRGFNQRDTPQALPPDIATNCDNVELVESSLGRRRPTSATVSLTSGPSAVIQRLFSHYTNASVVSELWALSHTTTMQAHRRVDGTWSSVSVPDTPLSAGYASAASLNNKLFIAYRHGQNRLHVWDGTAIRRVGILTGSAPTVANGGGAGAYPATLRYYRVGWRIKASAVVVATSELTAAVSFTPDGASTNATVTKPTTPDSATHWVVYGNTADVYDTYKELSEIAVGTTTYADTATPSAYTGDAPMQLGINIPPPQVKFVVSTDNRLLMAGVHATTAAASGETQRYDDRVYFTRVLGSSDQGDDESIPDTTDQKNWVDVGRNDGDTIAGMGGPIDGIVYVFKSRSVWRLIPTGIDTAPYRPELVTRGVGAYSPGTFDHQNIVTAEDETGQAVLYFIGRSGAYRISPSGGVQYVGWDVSSPTTGNGPAFLGGTYVPSRRQIWWIEHNTTYVYIFTPHLAQLTNKGWRGGWSRYTLADTTAAAIAMNDVALDGFLYPVIGATSPVAIHAFTGNSTSDNGTAFTASVTSAPQLLGAGVKRFTCEPPILEGAVQSGATPTVAYIADYGLATRSGATAALTAAGSETRKAVKAEAVETTDALALQVTVTWDSDQSNVIDAVNVPYRVQEWV